MGKLNKWPAWVRIYARKERKKLISQISGAFLGVLILVIIEYFLEGVGISEFLDKDNIYRYVTILMVFVFHVMMIHSANNWVERNSSFEHEDQYLTKWYSYLVGLFFMILLVVINHFILKELL